jgi:hypothetical protein
VEPTAVLERWARWRFVLLLPALTSMACSPEVVRRSTQLMTLSEHRGGTIEVLEDAAVSVGPGYHRVIGRGSVWTQIGRSVEGDVYKPVDRIFTVEGAHVHEAYLVLAGDRVVGFYLPVERAFSPAPDGPNTRLSIRRREP